MPKRQTAASTLLSGDERPEAHGRSGRSEGAAAGASERTGRADEQRALAGDRSHAGKPDGLLLPHLVRSRLTSDDVSPPRFSFRCCRRGSVNVEGAFLLNFKNSESKMVAGLLLVMQFEYSEEQDGGLGALDGSLTRATRRPPGGDEPQSPGRLQLSTYGVGGRLLFKGPSVNPHPAPVPLLRWHLCTNTKVNHYCCRFLHL